MSTGITLNRMTIRNFMSFGNVAHEFSFNTGLFSLIIGENRDVAWSGSTVDSNGSGKSTLINALSYVLYDRAIGAVKKDNLVNKFNEKSMEVSLEFTKDKTSYVIQRGRKPAYLRFIINGDEYKEDGHAAQGENRDTQYQIEKHLGISYDLFKQILAITAQDVSFLQLRQKEQKDIIEELLRITQLSEKADVLKEKIKSVSSLIDAETVRIDTLRGVNDKTLSQIQRLEKMSAKWEKDKATNVSQLKESIEGLEHLDIDLEIKNHGKMQEATALAKEHDALSSKKKSIQKSLTKVVKEIASAESKLKISKEENKCYVCGHDLDDDHEHLLEELTESYSSNLIEKETLETEMKAQDDAIAAIEEKLTAYVGVETFYDTEKEAWEHNNTITNLKFALEREKSQNNPYTDQIDSMKKESLHVIDNDKLEGFKTEKAHMDFLMKILTNKDSFVRKKIIDQSLTFLNYRLDHYTTEMGLPHTVRFQNDLTVSIVLLGREYDFDNLSRGQKTRLILALNFAFIDTFESLNSKTNLVFIDELIDNGLDGSGVDNAVKILKDINRNSNKSVFLVSHKLEIQPRVEKIIKVVMESGFSSLEKED